ncbi:hypothetical protein ACSQ8B_26205 [Marinovum sp. F03]|uniref:hypothetical protein n=1 Tax=Marinovum sp. F03 TaxID=3449226 RepID=UPI003EDC8EDF
MSYVHFDLAEVEAAMREVRERSLPVALQSISSADTKVAMLAQDRFFEAGVAAQLEAVRLRNEGRSAEFIGMVVGSFIGNAVVNAISASDEPERCLGVLELVMGQIIEVWAQAGGGADVSPFVARITGTAGGRA